MDIDFQLNSECDTIYIGTIRLVSMPQLEETTNLRVRNGRHWWHYVISRQSHAFECN